MKKSKPEKSTLPISLSAKKTGVLKHEMLFTPYKIEWKNVQPQSSNQTSSRTFFTSMKNQLSNFKNDIEKMIKKQTTKLDHKISKSSILEDSSNNTEGLLTNSVKHQNSKDSKCLGDKSQNKYQNCPLIQSKTIVEKEYRVDQELPVQQMDQKLYRMETLIKQCRLQKNLIKELKKQNHQLYLQTEEKQRIQQKLQREFENQNKLRVNQIENLSAEVVSLQSNLTELQNENLNLRSKNEELHNRAKRAEDMKQIQIQQFRRANEELRIHNSFLQQKIESLSDKMGLVTTKYREKQVYVRELEVKIQQLKAFQNSNIKSSDEQKKQLLSQYLKKLDEKEKQITEKYEQQIKIIKQSFSKKVQLAQVQNEQIIQQLEKQKQRLKIKLKKLQEQVHSLSRQNEQKKEIKEIKEIKEQQNIRTDKIDFTQLGNEFEKKINALIEENYGLKNKITGLEAQIQQIETHRRGLQNQVRLFQEAENERNNKQTSLNEWEKTLQQIRTLKKQKDQITEEFEYKIIKLQNQLQQQRNNKIHKCAETCQNSNAGITNFNKILKDQLQQNQDLKDKLRESIRQLNSVQRELKEQEQRQAVLNQQLAVEKMKAHLFQKKCQSQQVEPSNFCSAEVINGLKYDLDLLKKKYEALNSMLESKNKLIRSKDEFIQRVLISKAGKKQEEEEIAYILKEMKFLSPIQN